LIVNCCDCKLRVIVKEGINKANHPIQNPVLLVTEPRTRDNTSDYVYAVLLRIAGFLDGSGVLRKTAFRKLELLSKCVASYSYTKLSSIKISKIRLAKWLKKLINQDRYKELFTIIDPVSKYFVPR
jgi:hypothetical protein